MKVMQYRLSITVKKISKQSIYKLIRKYERTDSLHNLKPAPRPKKVKQQHLDFINDSMSIENELTGRQLRNRIIEKFGDLPISISTIKRARQEAGWISKRTRYCALISEVNKTKRLAWCQERIKDNDMVFDDVIWTDESMIQMESHRKRSFRKQSEPARLAGRAKHPAKVLAWGGISARGATPIVMFNAIMNAKVYTQILTAALLPFASERYPDGYRFQQDNDPKHTSKWAQKFFEDNDINWWRTTASSPDLNPIELVWGSMKEYLRTYAKPKCIERRN